MPFVTRVLVEQVLIVARYLVAGFSGGNASGLPPYDLVVGDLFCDLHGCESDGASAALRVALGGCAPSPAGSLGIFQKGS